MMATVAQEWKRTACILCSQNCGLEVLVENGHFTKIKGNKAHPASQGYTCQKALRLDHYQNGAHRLTAPLRKRADGTFEEISWETAITEVAAKLKTIRDTHGGHTIAQFGGGGQGNHLNGFYAGALRAACDTRYLYTSLAQEKTGGFWLDGRLFGAQGNIPIPDHHGGEFMLIIGWNPWQSHGMQRARKVLQDIAKDPNYTLVVVDPRRTETAERADVHLQVRPGGDAHLMLAMLGVLVQEGLEDKPFLEERCVGAEELRAIFAKIPVAEYCEKAGLAEDAVRDVTRRFAKANGACVHTDLGLDQSVHSTLNLYLSKLLFLFTGNFGRRGGQVLIPTLVPLVGQSRDPEEGGRTARVTGAREIGKLYPPNVLPQEIDNDSPDRLRALFVDSGNPAVTVADSTAVRKAFEKLELLLVVDVAMTETARMADYVLPASSQFEKWEATFFNFGFPDNFYHLRPPIFEPQGDTLPEPEIYRRIAVAMGELPDSFPELEEAAREHVADPSKGIFPMALAKATSEHPELRKFAPIILYSTLGKALPNGAASAAVLWMVAQQFAMQNAKAVSDAGIKDEGAGLGEALFKRIIESPSGFVFSRVDADETWKRISTEDKKVHLVVAEMLEEIDALAQEAPDEAYPFVLQAGERRDYNANQIIRTSAWRKMDAEGALKVHPEDAAALGLEENGRASVSSSRGTIQVSVTLTDEVRRGFVTLPHGYGMRERFDGEDGGPAHGPEINVLSDANYRDRIAATPFHKSIPVQIAAVREESQLEAATAK